MSQKQPLRPKSRDEFEIAIICALALEADAVLTLFDHRWDEDFGKAYGDPNTYSTGVIGQHNVVLAHLPGTECTICAACNGNSDPVCEIALRSNCKELKCDAEQRLSRDRLGGVKFDIGNESLSSNNDTLFPTIHFGAFASGDSLIRSAGHRDQLATSKDVIGFEMESVGVWEIFPTVVIKGVSNYTDSHKNDDWQDFAAASAAACTKAFLRYWVSTKEEDTRSGAEEQKPRETAINNIRFPEAKGRKDDNTPPASPTTNQ
ncbi:hypothetical protein FPSE5266_10877 [Fusarium pseudograminearum]|nr:hypothetical protein FPSE5266_10877 [Fusarium pseudograminearum]